MEKGDKLLVRVLGKSMELSVYEDRVVLYKDLSAKFFSAEYSSIHSILYRDQSYEKTGFIKVRAQGCMFDFVTYKTRFRDTSEEINELKDEMRTALNEIETRARNSRNLPGDARLTTNF